MIAHIRRPMPPKRGNSFYRDKTDYSKYALSLCGAPITPKDVDYRTAGTKKFLFEYATQVCQTCLEVRRNSELLRFWSTVKEMR